MRGTTAMLGLSIAASILTGVASAQDSYTTDTTATISLEASLEGLRNPGGYVVGGAIEPRWLSDGNRFWFIKEESGALALVVVDPTSNTVSAPVFLDWFETRIAELGEDVASGHVSISAVEPLTPLLDSIRIWIGDRSYTVQAESSSFVRDPSPIALPTKPMGRSNNRLAVDGPPLEAFTRDYNIWLRELSTGAERQVTDDGTDDFRWRRPVPASPGSIFSLDGRHAVFLKEVSWPRGRRTVPHFYQDNALRLWKGDPRTTGHEETPLLGWWRIPGPNARPFLVDLENASETPLPVPDPQRTCPDDVGERFPCGEFYHLIGWLPDGSEFLFTQGFQDAHPDHSADLHGHDLRLLAFDPERGTTRTIIEEGEDLHVLSPPGNGGPWLGGGIWLLADDTFLWFSERDGWRHIYRYALSGNLLGRVTSGSFPVDWILAVDEEEDWVYFTGADDPERPYDRHLYRAHLDGSGFIRLTEAPGVHDPGVHVGYSEEGAGIDLSPSLEFFLDTHSTVDRPPTVELRRSDGTFLRVLDQADISRLENELGWTPPEEFVVKAADGITDLYGVLYKPSGFDATASYPVVELIHNLPEAILVEHGFNPEGKSLSKVLELRGLAETGFVIIKLDSRGTGERGRAFSDWALFGDHERITADHAGALQQLAAGRPWMDLSRVGIIGISRGSLQALRAMVQAPDVYDAVVTISTIVGTGHSWELSPTGVIPLLKDLEGMHLMIQGTEDSGWIDMLRLSEEYGRLGKQHRAVILPGAGHVPWGKDRLFMNATIRDFFSRMLRN